MGDSATLSNLAPLGIAFALLLVGGVAAMWRLSWSVIPTRDAWPARLRRMAGQSPWTKRDLAWLLLLLALARPVLDLGGGAIELYRPLLFVALLLALHLGLALTRRPRVYRRLPAHYHREGE